MSADEALSQNGGLPTGWRHEPLRDAHRLAPPLSRCPAAESVLSEAPLVVIEGSEALPQRARHILQNSGTPLWGLPENDGGGGFASPDWPPPAPYSRDTLQDGPKYRTGSFSPAQISSLSSSPLTPQLQRVSWILGCLVVVFSTSATCLGTEVGSAALGRWPAAAVLIAALSAPVASVEAFVFARRAAVVVLFDLQPFAEFDSIWAQMPTVLAAIVAWLNTSFAAVAALSSDMPGSSGVAKGAGGLCHSAAQCYLIMVLAKVLLFRKAVRPDPPRAKAASLLRFMAASMVIRTTAGLALNPARHLALLQSVQSSLALHFAAFFVPAGVLFYVLCLALLRLPRDDGLPQLSLLSAQINTLFFHVPFVWADRKMFLRFIFLIGLCIGINIAATDLAEPVPGTILAPAMRFALMVLMPVAGALYWLFLLATTPKCFVWGEETTLLVIVAGLQLTVQGALLAGSFVSPSQLVTVPGQSATVLFVITQSLLLGFRRAADGGLLFEDDSHYFVFAGTQNWFFVLNIARVFMGWSHLAHGMLLVASGKEPLGPLNIAFLSLGWVDFLYQAVVLLMPKLAVPSYTSPLLDTATPKVVSNTSNVHSFRSSDVRSLSFNAWEVASSCTSLSHNGRVSGPALPPPQGSPLWAVVVQHCLMAVALLALLFSTGRGGATLGLGAGPAPRCAPAGWSQLLRALSSAATVALIFGPVRQALQAILPAEDDVQTSVSLLRVWRNYAPMATALCAFVFYAFLLFQGLDAALRSDSALGLVASLLDALESLAWLYFTHFSLAAALPMLPEQQPCHFRRSIQVFAAWRVAALVVWVAVGADPLAQLPRVAGRLGAHYLSSFVFPLQLLYFLVLALRLGDAEQPSESLSCNLLLVSLPSVRYSRFLYCCLASSVVAAVHAALVQTSLFGPTSIPGAFLLLDVLVLGAVLYSVRLLYSTPKRLHWTGTSQLLLASCAIAVAFNTLRGALAPPKDATRCGPRQATVCVVADQLAVSSREVFLVVQAVLLCHRQTGNTHNASLPAFVALNVMLFVSAMLEVERDFYTQVDWSSYLQFVCQSFGFAYYGLVISLYTEQIWKAAATFSGGQ